MAEAAIPVDLTNPGQVFACLGLVEAAEILLGNAEAAFDWRDGATTFRLRARGEPNPVVEVIRFLVEAEVVPIAPEGADGPWPEEAERSRIFPARIADLRKSDGKGLTGNALPAVLRGSGRELRLFHWLDGSGLETFKLFAGNQVGWQIAEMLLSYEKAGVSRKGVRQLWRDEADHLICDPFGVADPQSAGVVPIDKGKFGFDARGAWDAVRVGASLDAQSVPLNISPVVELLAAIGLGFARPALGPESQVYYSAWNIVLPASLCRVVLAQPESILVSGTYCRFRTHMGDDKYYKKFFFADME
ncbi:type I-G CRISPR-associated protein Cas8g2 [Propylenella binzhouense]|uniref:Type I-U CRISPR-associated protein Cas8c n=1 Tax=Propylenella binzhouense TaxID=2555902 RepID=A0A964WS59_9HYPH|nr:type I-U CRISPR-associated protein Cas8c [Propylenella binzhouense]MYZ46623.1 type I-U CRISPR-associated protein Cas8c [Propylenella binzhouense]